jgi:catechol 2,3-dioxygenase-like lactoylglutathione lyase family enzyme
VALVHHTGLWPADMDESLRFYVDGVGLSVLFDVNLSVDLEPLLGVTTSKVRTVFLGDPAHSDAGVLELVDLGTGSAAAEPPGSGLPRRGAFLVSFHVPVEKTLGRLASLGLGGTPRRMPTPAGGLSATVVDPDGIVVELLDQPISLGS